MKPMSRRDFVKSIFRGSLFAGIAGLCAVLASREEVFECSSQCGQCLKFKEGKCALRIK